MARRLLTGNEAIALGAHSAGVRVAAGYPGTPSTEIIESIVECDYPDIYAEWAPNEKVALEVAIGACLAGVRAMATMKHVGVNVASDPLMTASYIGTRGGLVIVTADDPGMHSSQNEQDSRNYARFAKVPMLEPSDSQQAHDMMLTAFRISEEFTTPVFLRSTTRISHSRSVVCADVREESAVKPGFVRDPEGLVMIPGHARKRHPVVEERLEKLRAYAEEAEDLNRMELRDRSVGVVTGGIAYQYVWEGLPEASTLKLGLSYPLPMEMIRSFAERVDNLYVIEELDPFWETQIRAAGIEVTGGKDVIPLTGELSTALVTSAVAAGEAADSRTPGSLADLPARPPVLCPGCPHRGVFYTLSKLEMLVSGDIGCYSLGVMPPLSAMDTLTCMGASISHAMGIEKALGDEAGDMVAVIGDSTFMHSGLTSLADVVYNDGSVTTVILDNHTTAMTGHQGHPASGKNARTEEAPRIDLAGLVRGLGVEDVHTVDPYDLEAVERAVKDAGDHPGPSVVIADRPCALLRGVIPGPDYVVSKDCVSCGMCLQLGCPALVMAEDGRAAVDSVLCNGCGLCVQVCAFGAIREDDA